MSTTSENPSAQVISSMSIAVVGPDERRRNATARDLVGCQIDLIREFDAYPSNLEAIKSMLKPNFDVVMVDLDSNPEVALDLVENVRFNNPATVMVYSAQNSQEMIVRSMRAGAREFLLEPFTRTYMAEALCRASALRPTPRIETVTEGKLLVFLSAKGGSGVTTMACTYAVSLARESGKNILFIDLNLPLGDAAINFGIHARYSTLDALQNSSKLDASYLSTLLVKYSNNLSVLAAPGSITTAQINKSAINKLLEVARQEFDYVVVDAGSRLDLQDSDLIGKSATVYLITQVGIPELRKANRLISEFFLNGGPSLEVVVNRHQPGSSEYSEQDIAKALMKPPHWRVPNDYAAVRRMQDSGIPLALENSSITRMIEKMSRSVCGQPDHPEKKKKFSFLR